jgi:DNA-binding NtrC family response regulator
MKALITLTDVEPAVRLNALLESSGVQTAMVSPMDDLPSAVKREKPDVIVVTGNLLDPSTQALVRQQLWDGAAVVGLADVGDRDLQQRLKAGGFSEVMTKPVQPEELANRVTALLERRELAERTGLYGESEAVREVLVKIEQMAPVSSTVLIEGESGTGKELVARSIHQLSPRRGKPFIAVNVGALPETLLESELFGHEKGSFTGAAERRIGRFELADGGTIFLDEIGDVPPSTQVKLLRVLEEREVTRVGGTQVIPVDVRVVTATNRPLKESVERGFFRSDLYYRLNVLSIYLPPLRSSAASLPRRCRRWWITSGPATCASCATWWRAWWCSRMGGRSGWRTFQRTFAPRAPPACCRCRSGRCCARERVRAGGSWSSSCGRWWSSSCRWKSCEGGWTMSGRR